MGEYATFRGEQIKIGTCEDMYYLRFDQRELVTPESGNVNPVTDAPELRFRFPWPDEDANEPGDFEDYNRGLTIYGVNVASDVEHYSVQFAADAGYLVSLPCPESGESITVNGKPLTIHRNGFKGAVQLVRQKIRPGIGLCPILRCACGAMWRVEGRSEIEELAVLVRSEGDRRTGQQLFYHTIADRLLAGLLVTA